jgi:hypothetical protein
VLCNRAGPAESFLLGPVRALVLLESAISRHQPSE